MARNCCPPLSRSLTCPIDTILIVEDSLADARLLQELLRGSVLHRATVVHAQRLTEAIHQCSHATVDVVMLDLTLPDSYGLASLDTLLDRVPGLPVVVLTNTQDDDLAVEAVRRGAQDYLFKRQVNQDVLVRALRYAVERQQVEAALREANETLEQRVHQRTSQLQNMNTLLLQQFQERQHIQDRLTLAQKAAKIGTFEWQLFTNQVIWSPELEALYGVEPGEFGNHCDVWLQTIDIADRPTVEQALQHAIANHQPLDAEFRILQNPHTRRWIAVKSNVFFDSNGEPQRLVGIHMDITDSKQMEAQFLRVQRLESLGTLASGIAHDFNNILTPMLGVVQLLPLKVPELSPSTRHLLDTLEVSARRGSSLIKQILSFARGVEGQRISVKLSYVLQEVRQILKQTLPKSIDVSLEVEPHLWTVSGDITQLHQVVMNLCVNARDAMPQGGTLRIQAGNICVDTLPTQVFLEACPGRYVVVTIVDTGQGIPSPFLPRIFDPFFTTKAVGQGTGLGLSAVLGIVKSHGGFIEVQSQVNEGSQFSVYLPACELDESGIEADLTAPSGHDETVLIVDDEAAIREVLKATLETYHYRVLTADSGTQAIALYQNHQADIDVLLIDMMMPGMDGTAVMSLLKHVHPAVKAIAMSGFSSESMIGHAEKIGFQAVLPKPITAQALLSSLRNCLED